MSGTIFLHHYDASPFSQKAIKMLAIKGVEWRSVLQPMIAPKPELTALTGGYRGTPVLQIGADIYIDSQRIAEELEHRFPAPTLYPGGKGIAHMMCDFGDSYFRAGLDIAIREFSTQWDEDFYRDRDAVFPDLDFSQAEERFPDGCAKLQAQARLINEQLSDGRPFLMGDAPGLADIQVYVVNWFARAGFPTVSELFSGLEALTGWEARMAALGEGERIETSSDEAFAAAREAKSVTVAGIYAHDPLGFAVGDRVNVGPLTSARGEAAGRLVRLDPQEIAIAPDEAKIDGVIVHYPRLGYAVTRA